MGLKSSTRKGDVQLETRNGAAQLTLMAQVIIEHKQHDIKP
jgi:hypothetical protein